MCATRGPWHSGRGTLLFETLLHSPDLFMENGDFSSDLQPAVNVETCYQSTFRLAKEESFLLQ